MLSLFTPRVHAQAPAASPDDPAARSAFEVGRQAYDRGAFVEALAHFERAYALSKRPELLYNIGRAADFEGQAARAASAYAGYLEALPKAENQAFVRARLAKMQALMKADGGAERALPEAESESPAYRALIDEAVREAFEKNYEEARSLFLRAHAIFPNARTHRGIAMTEFELRNYPECIAQLEAALRSPVRPLEGKLRSDAEQLRARAQAFVGRLVIETKPAASELRVDGVPIAPAAGAPLIVRMGEHVVEAQRSGYAPEKRHVNVKGGELETLTIMFSRPLAAPTAGEGRRWHKSPWLWTAVGAVAAGSVTAAVLASRGGDRVAAPLEGNVGSQEGP